METEDLLLIGAIGIGAFLLFNPLKKVTEQAGQLTTEIIKVPTEIIRETNKYIGETIRVSEGAYQQILDANANTPGLIQIPGAVKTYFTDTTTSKSSSPTYFYNYSPNLKQSYQRSGFEMLANQPNFSSQSGQSIYVSSGNVYSKQPSQFKQNIATLTKPLVKNIIGVGGFLGINKKGQRSYAKSVYD